LSQEPVTATQLRSYILDEVTKAFGFSCEGVMRRVIGTLFAIPAHRFAQLVAGVDRDATTDGVQQAAINLLNHFTESVQVIGQEHIPAAGPLLLACNHPGAFDSVAVTAFVPRRDLKIVVSGVPFLQSLPSLAPSLIYAPGDAHERMIAVRSIIRHLRDDGAVIIFATGKVDPDPAILPGAPEALQDWSPSLEIVMRRAPETRFLPVIISGVLNPNVLRIPFVRQQDEPWKQRRLAEYFQIAGQLYFRNMFKLNPKLSFGIPVTLEEMRSAHPNGEFMPAVIAQANRLLKAHLEVDTSTKMFTGELTV
jgi:hypothetical protein